MRIASTLVVILALTASAQAHFIWLAPVSNEDGVSVHVYFGEDASPDDPAYLSRLKGMTLQRVTGAEPPVALELKLTDNSLSATVPESDEGSLFIASHDLGVFDRGDAVFRLLYYAKSGPAVTGRTWQSTDCSDDLRLDMTPSVEEGTITVTVRFEGEPAAGAQIVASGPGLADFEGETDEAGRASFEMAEGGLYSIRARHIVDEAGELGGKAYPETRHYTTVAVTVPSVTPFEELAMIPQPVTSFGAAIADGYLYTYGGHTGDAHSYSLEEQGNTLQRLDLATREWETLIEGPPLQGLALVAHDGKLYRLGGFTAMNAQGEDHDLRSQASVACYDPAVGEWTELPPLPEPRSSFDAAVLGGAIYIVGGWSIQGEEERIWHSSTWKLDLTRSQAEWQALPSAPFQRRALALAAHGGKLYAIGGMQEEGGPTRRVGVFDPATATWSEGPELAGDGRMAGFGSSAFATSGRLYASTIGGNLQCLRVDGSKWEVVARTPTARFFHRMLALDDDHLIVVGGANMGIGKFGEVEVLDVGPNR